ncbi:hypothetical protein SE15_10115 [Thermanaerothrix daxensis]|uniref:VTT domain-containing protein n=1 Tax=Thermanaerothrix daxensis TaxID=869279 RepID=A0A0P6XTZ8_9CHLR|nr:VTT domain-containing protein [Thermanaerothrix daxensis]KPL82491.1 hypothetical protein SE15_10115 [Thermanaerothrix daxensis]
MEGLLNGIERALGWFHLFPVAPVGLWFYPLLVLMVALEGPVSILLAATAASAGFVAPVPVFLAASLGNLIADTLWYALGYAGKLEWLTRWPWLGITPAQVERLKEGVRQHALKILVIAKLTNGMIIPALIATGLARVPLRRWFGAIFLTNLVITGAFVAAGYFMANSLMQITQGVRYLAIASTLLFLILGMLFLPRLLRRHPALQMDGSADSHEPKP